MARTVFKSRNANCELVTSSAPTLTSGIVSSKLKHCTITFCSEYKHRLHARYTSQRRIRVSSLAEIHKLRHAPGKGNTRAHHSNTSMRMPTHLPAHVLVHPEHFCEWPQANRKTDGRTCRQIRWKIGNKGKHAPPNSLWKETIHKPTQSHILATGRNHTDGVPRSTVPSTVCATMIR